MTTTLAVMGTVLGIFNTAVLVWQWRQSGPVVTVNLRAGWYMAGGGIASHEAAAFAANPRPDGGRPVVIVRVTNRGRSAVDINEWWITIGPAQLGMLSRFDPALMERFGAEMLMDGQLNLDDVLLQAHNEPCPYRLDSHSSKSWVLAMDSVAEVVGALVDDQDAKISAVVHMGSGRTARAKERVEPVALGIGRGVFKSESQGP